MNRLWSDSDLTAEKLDGGESRFVSVRETRGFLDLRPSFSFEDEAPGGPA